MSDALERWLSAATGEITPPERARARNELSAHYQDALASYTAQGLAPEQAAVHALADLGDPIATARAFRRSRRRNRLYDPGWLRRQFPLAALALLAALGAGRIVAGSVGDIGQPTALAMILQTAALTIALCIPLIFDDLDLSAGVAVMLGALVARAPYLGAEWVSGPVPLAPAIFAAALLGAGLGTLNGLVTTLSGRPAALVTIGSGAALALGLASFPRINNLAISSADRLTLPSPSIGLLLLGLALAITISLAAKRWCPERSVPPAPIGALGAAERLMTLLSLAGLLLLPVAGMAAINITIGHPLAFGGWLAITLALLPAGIKLLPRASDSADQRAARQKWRRTVTGVGLVLGAGGIALASLRFANAVEALMTALLGTAMIALVAAAFAHLIMAALAGQCYAWLVRQPRNSGRRAGLRILSMTLCSTLAAVIGVMACAQGIRDNTYVLCASFYVLTPLAAIFVGGWHRLRGHTRLLGAALGGLATAALCTPLGSDNLAPGAVAAVLLAALTTLVWPGIAGERPSGQPEPTGEPARDQVPLERIA